MKLVGLTILACLLSADYAWSTQSSASSYGQRLQELFDEYMERRFELDPYYATTKGDLRFNRHFSNILSPDWIARYIALEQQYAGAVGEIPEGELSRRDRIDRQVFLYTRRKYLEYYRYPVHLLPINPVNSRLNNFARMGSGSYYFPFETVADYDAWLSRVEAAGPWFEQHIENFRGGIQAGVIHPRVVAERLLPQVEAHIVGNPEESLYYQPIRNMPDAFSPAERQRLDAAYRRMIVEDLVPFYRRIAAFLRQEYLPAARASTAWRSQPGGETWYRQLIRYYTSTKLSGQEIHEIGLEQVSLIEQEMEQLLGREGYEGSLHDWLGQFIEGPAQVYGSEEEVLHRYRSLLDRANSAAGRVFDLVPKTGLMVKSVEPFRADSASAASYRRPPADLSGPGIFYINTSDLRSHPEFGVETLFMHEAIPGHHFQLALMLEMDNLPLVRRCETEIAFTEGWALYAQSLGTEMGFYRDPMQRLGYLNSMRFRAARLVVDTGLHQLGWNRAQALGYLGDHTSRAPADIRKEVDRYIARPGQALAYMLGYLQIRDLRRLAESALGDRFDIRDFHRAVLEDGALPLPILQDKIEAWISVQGATAARLAEILRVPAV
jgi:uncharacterized protein (DUF885 family)